MKTFIFNIGGKLLRITINDFNGSLSKLTIDGVAPELSGEEMAHYVAVISLALIEEEQIEVHDDETDVITLEKNRSHWGDPSDMFNTLTY